MGECVSELEKMSITVRIYHNKIFLNVRIKNMHEINNFYAYHMKKYII